MDWLVGVAAGNSQLKLKSRLSNVGYQVYFPVIRERLAVPNGRVKVRARYLFGRYFFVGINKFWVNLFSIDGIVQVLTYRRLDSADELPCRVSDQVVGEIRALESESVVEPVSRFRRGQSVRVSQGPFIGFDGVYSGSSAHGRELVLVDVFGRKVKVELGYDQVEGTLP
jgi:transcriptional antiterminator RfaH